MTIHVGIFPYTGRLSIYDAKEKQTDDLSIAAVNYDENEKVRAMFRELLSKINGKLGCVCLCLHDFYGNEIRKQFIDEGLTVGFINVEIIDFQTALYLVLMSQVNYKPLKGCVIWLCYERSISVWHMGKQKAKFIGEWDDMDFEIAPLENIVKESELSKGPDAVLYYFKIKKTNFYLLSPTCQFFYYGYYTRISRGSLIKAQTTAGDREVLHLETESILSENFFIKYEKDDIISFHKGQHLPITYSQQLTKKPTSGVLEVISTSRDPEYFRLPNNEKVLLMFKMNLNEIYSLKLEGNTEMSNSKNMNLESAVDYNENDDEKFFLHALTTSNYGNYAIPVIGAVKNFKMNTAGIDLGTSRCCAAVNRKNGIATVPLDNTGDRLLPSYVAYDEENVKCGKIAVNRLRYHSKSTIFDSKRIIGRKFNDIEIDEHWDFNICFENSKTYMEVKGFNRPRKITAEENAAELLKFIKRKAEEFQGIILKKAVITVPAAFNKIQKITTVKAAKMAGWDEVELLPEPIAAAFAYLMNRPFSDNSIILLFDIGGGTMDVCIFKIENCQIKIISNTGDSKFGGRDFDTILINYFKNLLKNKYEISNLKDKKYKLMLECQRIKEDLSSFSNTMLHIDDFDTDKDGIIFISREEFENMTQNLITKVRNTIQSALFTSSYKPDQINKILLVGGGSRMPMIKNLLKEIFPDAEQCCEEHPDEVVAIGAAYYASSILSE